MLSLSPLLPTYSLESTQFSTLSFNLKLPVTTIWITQTLGMLRILALLILLTPPAAETAIYRNRKGFVSQNCLFVCNFTMKFYYVLTGWIKLFRNPLCVKNYNTYIETPFLIGQTMSAYNAKYNSERHHMIIILFIKLCRE